MLVGFQRRFAQFVEEGTKTHTIRALRLRPPRVGEVCHCYVDPRQKSMRLLGRFPCVKVETITIWESARGPAVKVDGTELSDDECNALAWRDGFRDQGHAKAFRSMMQFWAGRLPFRGQIIHWRYTNLIQGPKRLGRSV